MKTINYEFEDIDGVSGRHGTLNFEIDYTYSPGEPMVRYYKDGSGYPGSGPEIEFSNFRCVSVWGRPTLPLDSIWLGLWFEEWVNEHGSCYDDQLHELVMDEIEKNFEDDSCYDEEDWQC